MGKFLAPYAFYGYVKDPDNKGHIIIDEPAAEIVRRIFNMRLSGRTTKEIAQQLNKDGVLTPAEYKKSIDPLCREWNTVSKYKCWTASMITNITSDERYTGKLNVKLNDTVQVITGKYAGKQGKVIATSPKNGTVTVDGVNMHKKAKKARKANEVSQIVEIPGPIDVSNVMVVCPSCGLPVRVKHSIIGGKKHRICVKCGAGLDKEYAKAAKAAAKKEEPKKRVRKRAKKEETAEESGKTE